MQIHFIAIGGAAMHNLALALHKKGFIITGSDDEIYEPSRTRLSQAGILPESIGWFPDKITQDLDAVVLGMHARIDNPELLEAQKKGIKIYSYPEFVFEQTKNKTRIVIGGSHGKTTLTSMIMHVLKELNFGFDYLVGSQIEGFDLMVRIDDKNKIAIFEGDEYLASPIDRRPKFHLYQPQIGLITGIAWDHINVFPTFENYVEQFRIFAEAIPENGKLFYCNQDEELNRLVAQSKIKSEKKGYGLPLNHINENRQTVIEYNGNEFALNVFGNHNLMNLEGARLVCETLGIGAEEFYEAIQSFKGAARRLELVMRTREFVFYRDFAHSPSKLKATTNAIANQFNTMRVIACMELHTFSSLNEQFLKEYHDTLNEAGEAIVYFNPQTIAHKKLKPITVEQVKLAFNRPDLKVFTETNEFKAYLKSLDLKNACLLMMSSGTFDGIEFKKFAEELTIA